MVVLGVGYLFSRKFIKLILSVLWSIEIMVNGNYSLYFKDRGIYEEVFKNINMLVDILRVNEVERKENEELREEWLVNIIYDIKIFLVFI